MTVRDIRVKQRLKYVFDMGSGAKLFTCPYPLKVQTRPPRDQRRATQSRVSERDGREGAIDILKNS